MADIEFAKVSKVYGARSTGCRRPRSEDRRRGVRRARRAVGMRKDHRAANGRRPRGDQRGNRQHRWAPWSTGSTPSRSTTSRWSSRTTPCTRTCRSSRDIDVLPLFAQLSADLWVKLSAHASSGPPPRSSDSTDLLKKGKPTKTVRGTAPAAAMGARRPRTAGVPDGRAAVEPGRQLAQMRSEISRIQPDLAVTTIYVTHDQIGGDDVATRSGVAQEDTPAATRTTAG